MIAKLQQIKDVVQTVAEAIASALNMEVEIFDNNLVVVGATGRIRSKIGFKQETSHVSRYSLETGSSCTIDNPGENQLCVKCKIKNDCFCTAALICPINMNGVAIGTIGLLSFDEKQRKILLDQQGQFVDFIARMGELLAGRAHLNEALNQLASSDKLLKTTINSVSEGILAVDINHNISYINKAAEKMVNRFGKDIIGKPIQQFFPGSPLPAVIDNRIPITRGEVTYNNNNSDCKFSYSAYPIILDDSVVGAVKIFTHSNTKVRHVENVTDKNYNITFDDIKGDSPILNDLIEQAKIVASSRSTILIRGDSGTGKELFARAIHQASPYRNDPFLALNCSAIPEMLLESELFGYEEGAFTGARKGGKPGKFELANGGTLFLDEIGDMPLFLQAKLLRILESNTLERVGGTKEYHFNLRLIAATNHDLELLLREGKFRSDLYYRLNVVPLYISSLKERRIDILTLARHFIEKYSFLMGKTIISIQPEVEEILLDYSWPGNIRELQNVIEYAINFEQGTSLNLSSLPKWLFKKQQNLFEKNALKNKTIEREHEIIKEKMTEYGSSLEAKKLIAEDLGISVTTLYRKIKKTKDQPIANQIS